MLWEGDPDLNAVEFLSPLSKFHIGSLGMDDAAARRHPVDRARFDRLHAAETISMNDRAGKQIGDRGQADMRMGPHVDAPARRELGRSHLIEKDERSDATPFQRRQHAAHFESADIARTRHDDAL